MTPFLHEQSSPAYFRSALLALSLLTLPFGAGCNGQVVVGGGSGGGTSGSADSSSSSSSGPSTGSGTTIDFDGDWWVLVHPSDAPLGPGIYLYDEESQEIKKTLPLPPGVGSPHGLAFDGASLWMSDLAGGSNLSGEVHQIDPNTGVILSTISGIFTEGLVADGANLWYGADEYAPEGASAFVAISQTGAVLDVIALQDWTIMNDITYDGQRFYYTINDESDRIIAVDPATGAQTELASNIATSATVYTLAFDGTYLATVDPGGSGNLLRRFDRVTGSLVSTTPFGVPGWVTAIVPNAAP